MSLSNISSNITLEYLQSKRENQYFKRKGFGEKDLSPTKKANELIGMLKADGGVLAFGVSNDGQIQDLKCLGEKLSDYRNLFVDFIEQDKILVRLSTKIRDKSAIYAFRRVLAENKEHKP
jgi:ATP-dependent DNA helicase RecG